MNDYEKEQLLEEDRQKEKQKYTKISNFVYQTLSDCKVKRKSLENKWLRNRRQYDQIDDNVNQPPPGRSKTFEPYTTLKVDQQHSRLYELFMPTGDKNFGLFPSNYPSLPIDKLKNIIANLEERYNSENQTQGAPLPKSIIQKAIKLIAQENAKKLEDLMEDYLIDSNFEEHIQHLTLSACMSGVGCLKGPMLRKKKRTVYEQDDYGNWKAKNVEIQEPYVEFLNIFDWFPDLDAKTREDQDFNIVYQTINKKDLLNLKENKSYINDAITDFVKNNPDGNFRYEPYEIEIMKNGNEDVNLIPKKYRLTEFWGNVEASLVRDILDLEEDEDYVSVNVVMLDRTVIKCVLNPFDSKEIPIHYFNLYTRGGQLTGYGLPDLLQEKQRQLNVVVRGKHDNIAEIVVPQKEINTDLFLPQNMPSKMNPGKYLFRTGLGDTANYPAIRQVTTTNVTADMLNLEQSIKRDMDIISSLSGVMTGDMNDVGKTLGRTASGVGALMGGANTNLKNISKQFDNFLKKFYEMFIEIIFLITEDEDIKGDYQVVPKVSSSIVDKQLNSNNLTAFVNQMQPEQRGIVDWKLLTRQQILYNSLDADLILLSADDIKKQEEQAQLQQEQMMQSQNDAQVQAQNLEQQKLEIENIKAQGKSAVDIANAQKILNEIDLLNSKGELDSILALHKVNNDQQKQSLSENGLKHNIMKDEFDRQEKFHDNQMSISKQQQ